MPLTMLSKRMKKTRISLQASEGLIMQAAGRIYAAYLTSGHISPGQEETWMQRAVREATRLAQIAEETLQSDEELD